MPAFLQTLLDERATLAQTVADMVTAAETRGTDLTEAEQTSIAAINTRTAEIDAQLNALADSQERQRGLASILGRIGQPMPSAETRNAPPEETRSLGSAFIESGEFRSYHQHPRGKSDYVEFDAPRGFEFRAPTMTGGFEGSIPVGKVYVNDPPDQFPLFGLVGMEQVSSGTFEYVRSVFDDNAAVVPEGAVKPESTYTEQITPGALDTIAHWTQVTRQALEDSARIRSIIDGKLANGVQKKIHSLIAQELAASNLPTATSDTLLKAIRIGIGTVQAEGFVPNAVLLNPADWAELDVDVLGLTMNGPVRNQTFWGLRPVADPAQPAGTATVGDFREGVTLFYRSGVGIYATDSHADTFISNVFTILAERRAKAAVLQPAALVEATATATP